MFGSVFKLNVTSFMYISKMMVRVMVTQKKYCTILYEVNQNGCKMIHAIAYYTIVL